MFHNSSTCWILDKIVNVDYVDCVKFLRELSQLHAIRGNISEPPLTGNCFSEDSLTLKIVVNCKWVKWVKQLLQKFRLINDAKTLGYIYYLILKIYFLYYSFCYHTFCDSFIHSNLEIFLHLSLFIVVINKQTQLLYNYIKIQQHVFAYNFDNNLTIFFTKTWLHVRILIYYDNTIYYILLMFEWILPSFWISKPLCQWHMTSTYRSTHHLIPKL